MLNWPPPFPNPHAPGCFWHDWAEKFGSPDLRICEQVTCGVISSPVNTWSNLAYLAVGFYLWRRNREFSLLIMLLGALSFLGHASNIYPTLLFDIAGTFSLVGWCLGMNLARLKMISRVRVFSVTMGVALIGVTVVHLVLLSGENFAAVVPAGAAVVLWTEFRIVRSRRWLWASVALLCVGFFFSHIDLNQDFCRGTSLLQGHSFWHLATALMCVFIERHYRD